MKYQLIITANWDPREADYDTAKARIMRDAELNVDHFLNTVWPTVCSACRFQPVDGVLLGMNCEAGIQKCDECNLYDSDLTAALALALTIPGSNVMYCAEGTFDETTEEYEEREFPPVMSEEPMIAEGTDPWIVRADGSAVTQDSLHEVTA